MSSLALTRNAGLLSGLSVPVAGDISKMAVSRTISALMALKTENRAGSSLAFNDLHSLAAENGINVADSQVFLLAQRFLLALPAHLPQPELALDVDGEISFDWQGAGSRVLTATLREDGRLSYAARISSFDKEHGTKRFSDATPKQLIELIQRVTNI